MKNHSRWALGLAALLLLMPIALQPAGVQAAQAWMREVDAQHDEGLVQHIISPQATDPEIDTFLDSHYVWLDRSRESDHSRLWVFLPHTDVPNARARPQDFQLIAKEAARLGYHVISLNYPNRPAVVAVCNPLPTSEERDSCYEKMRLQTIDGIPRSNFTSVNPPNSIMNRLTKLLMYLAANFPAEGWKHFLKDGAPRWSRIVIAGHSQGGGHAAMIGKLHRVARVAMISSPVDGCQAPPAPCVGNPDQAARWVAIGATPADRYFGLAHQHEFTPPILANWKALGLNAFGAPVMPETSAPPYGCTHILLTDLLPATGSFRQAHGSTVRDDWTPRLADGTPALRDAWRYISGNPDEDAESCENESEAGLLLRS